MGKLSVITIGPMGGKGSMPPAAKKPKEDDAPSSYEDDAIKESWGEVAQALGLPDSDDACEKLVSFVKLVAMKADEEPHDEGPEETEEE